MKKKVAFCLVIFILVFQSYLVFGEPDMKDPVLGIIENNGHRAQVTEGEIFLGDDGKYYKVTYNKTTKKFGLEEIDKGEDDPLINPLGWLKKQGLSNPTAGIGDNSQADDFASSAFKLTQTWLRIAGSIIISLLSIKYMMAKTGQEIKGAKDWFINITIGLIIGFSVNKIIKILFVVVANMSS